MISIKWAKLIKSLHLKKYRKTEQLFFVEGEKAVLEVLASGFHVRALFATETFLQQHSQVAQRATLLQQCSNDELVKVGTFSSNDAALAVVEIPQWPLFSAPEHSWTIVLDNINARLTLYDRNHDLADTVPFPDGKMPFIIKPLSDSLYVFGIMPGCISNQLMVQR
ncbi:hypothetical protein [Arsukibacterium sp.]|uniref:hypothetical protein n=1 Tax=Arsukibacterium sp. TaxID=1977258 RepID=UPI002FDB89CD